MALCHSKGRAGRAILTRGHKEESMAKGQMRSGKEAKKPKSEKPKSSASDYKKSQSPTGQSLQPPGKKS